MVVLFHHSGNSCSKNVFHPEKENQKLQTELRAQVERTKWEEQHNLYRKLKTQKERIRREDQPKLQQERDRFQRQLREIQQEHNQTQEQLRNAQQEHVRTKEQLRRIQDQMRNQEESVRTREVQLQQHEENMRGEIWNELWESMQAQVDMPAQGTQQRAGDQQSKEELRGQEESLPRVQRMQEQLQGELRGQEESRARVRQLREQIQRELWGQEDLPRDERLHELLKQRLGDVLHDHHLVEELYSNQPHWELLRQNLGSLHINVVSDYAGADLQPLNISIEFISQLQEQMGNHHRPESEIMQAMEDIQEQVTGRRPRR